jgi:hypothetical protein
MRGDVTTLSLPDGGTIDIPLPGATTRFAIHAPSILSAPDGDSRLPAILAGVTIGLVIGVAATTWYLKRK